MSGPYKAVGARHASPDLPEIVISIAFSQIQR
jgi:hypothetical protein